MQGFLGPATFGINPVVGVIVTVIGAIFGALSGIFGGGDTGALTSAINNLNQQMVKMGNSLLHFSWGIVNAVAAIFNLLKWLWGNVLGPLVHAIRSIVNQISRVLNKVLRPVLDAMKAQRAAILDLYNRFLRPIIVAIDRVRRIIHLFQLLHIHIFDGLDRTLSRIEGKLMLPIYRMLYRVNTLGNWISYILNLDALLHRGLLLGSINQNRGGTFSMLAGAPPLGASPAPFLPDTPPVTLASYTFENFVSGANTTLVNNSDSLGTDSPTRNLIACLTAPIDFGEGSPIGDLWACLKASAPLNL